MTTSVKSMFILAVVGAFVSGAFLSSPELRAYAAAVITSADIVDGTIQPADLATNAVTKAKIASGAVSNAKLGDGAVTNGKIAPNAVTSTRIMDDTITAADLKTDSVAASEIQGVSKLIFASCTARQGDDTFSVLWSGPSDFIMVFKCDVPGASLGDSVIASIGSYSHLCDTCTLAVSTATVFEDDTVKITVFNHNFDYADTLDYVYTPDEDGYLASVHNADSGFERIWTIPFNIIVYAK